MAGDYQHFDGAHSNKSRAATFGNPKGTAKPQPDSFRMKGTGTAVLSQPQKFSYTTERKDAVPKHTDRPVLGLKTDKNFIVSNAVNAILTAPPAPKEIDDPLKKKNYGSVPKYINRVKADIDEEYETLRALQREQFEEEERMKYLLPSLEVNTLREGLKKKWDAVNKEYQMITHIGKPDTQGLKRKKENCEREMAQLEKDMAMLEKAYVFVDTTI